MAIIKCPECGHQVSDKAASCPSCGVGIAGKVIKCPECGEIVFNDQALCPNCHCPLNNEVAEPVAAAKKTVPHIESEAKRKGKKSLTPWIVAFFIALAAVLVGLYYYNASKVQNEQEAYDNAMLSSEPAVLQNYLDTYSDAPVEHRDSIMSHLEVLKRVDLDWTNAVVSNSKSAILRYMQLHPNSIHSVEAKIKIDSLDWIDATQKNTAEAYQKYIEDHADGMYVDQAHDAFSQIDARKVNDDDKMRMSRVFSSFFNALASNDEVALTSCVDNILTSFLHKANASKTDVIGYMHKIHQAPDVVKIEYRLNNDWKIEKIDNGGDGFSYVVAFSVDQAIEHSQEGEGAFNTYKVSAKVSADEKITELNMQRIIQ